MRHAGVHRAQPLERRAEGLGRDGLVQGDPSTCGDSGGGGSVKWCGQPFGVLADRLHPIWIGVKHAAEDMGKECRQQARRAPACPSGQCVTAAGNARLR